MAEYPIKSRVAFLEVGDIFSFTESMWPDFIVYDSDELYWYYSSSNGANKATLGKHSQRIIMILGKKQIITKAEVYKYRNTETYEEYRTISEVSKALGLHRSTIENSINWKRNKKIPIEKIRPY